MPYKDTLGCFWRDTGLYKNLHLIAYNFHKCHLVKEKRV